jgi:ABC-type Fe3+/spermidine/putrescine transport system ATPase subunit
VSSSSPLLCVEAISAAWDGAPVLREVTFAVGDGEFLVLLGPNGSGKSTLLRTLAGFESPTAGRIVLDGRDLAGVPPHRRQIGLMFQEPALFPHRSVYENIAYAPLLARRSRPEVESEVGELVALLHLERFVDRRPDQLSGGERQRVALARTLAARPRIVLLDEPFASIDVEVRAELHAEFRAALARRRTAAIHVTHDREEGLFLGDRVVLLFDGQVRNVGIPTDVFRAPRTARAARFLGYNVLREDGGWTAVAPNDLRLATGTSGGVRATVQAVGSVGREELVILRTEDGQRLELRSTESTGTFVPGAEVRIGWSRSVPVTPD